MEGCSDVQPSIVLIGLSHHTAPIELREQSTNRLSDELLFVIERADNGESDRGLRGGGEYVALGLLSHVRMLPNSTWFSNRFPIRMTPGKDVPPLARIGARF